MSNTPETIGVTDRSVNVFADLGPPNPQERLLKADLVLSQGSADAPRAAAFTLSVAIPTFTSPILALATCPPSAGTGQPSRRLFRQIASLPNLLGPTTDLTAACLTQFPVPPPKA